MANADGGDIASLLRVHAILKPTAVLLKTQNTYQKKVRGNKEDEGMWDGTYIPVCVVQHCTRTQDNLRVYQHLKTYRINVGQGIRAATLAGELQCKLGG